MEEKMKKLAFLAMMLIFIVSGVYAAQKNMIMAGGYEVFQIKAPSNGKTVEQRAVIIQERVNEFLSAGTSETPTMKVAKLDNGAYRITGNGISIIDVQKADATAYKTTADALAKKWSDALAKAYVNTYTSPDSNSGWFGDSPSTLTATVDGKNVDMSDVGRYDDIKINVKVKEVGEDGSVNTTSKTQPDTGKQVINYKNLSNFAFTNADTVTKPVKGIVLGFCQGFGYDGQIEQEPGYSENLASKGIIQILPYFDVMNEGSVKTVDAIIDVIFDKLNLPVNTPIISGGVNMGGLSALVYTRYAKKTPVACFVDSPVCDLMDYYNENPDMQKTIMASLGYPGSFEDTVNSVSPVKLAKDMPKIPYQIVYGNDKSVNKSKNSDVFVAEMKKYNQDITYVEVSDVDKRFQEFVQGFLK